MKKHSAVLSIIWGAGLIVLGIAQLFAGHPTNFATLNFGVGLLLIERGERQWSE